MSAKDKIKKTGRYAAAAFIVLLLVYYCTHPALYEGDRKTALLMSSRTWVVIAVCVVLMAISLLPAQMSEKRNRQLSWCWFAAAPFAVYFSLLYLNAEKFSIHFFELNKIALVLTFVFLYLVQFLLLAVTGSIRFSVVIPAVLTAVLGIANCFVISFRGMALSAADFLSAGTAMTVASQYTYELDWYMFMEILCTFAICLVSLKLSGGRMISPVMRCVVLMIWCVISGSYYYVCCKTDFLEDHEIRSLGFTHQLRYKQYDMLFTTLCTCFYLVVDKPEGYSLEKVQEIAEPYLEDAQTSGETGTQTETDIQTETDTQTPNLIVIMNESFADYENIGTGLTLSEDNMPFLHGLTENTIKGNAYASIFGGNTPNSEYEFLTGNTMAFLPVSSVGFNLFVRGNLPSVASLLKANGYETLAMHPYRGTNYRRNIVYPQLGFDTYYTRENFANPYYVRSYISDETLGQRIISEYEKNEKTGQPLFSYNVTIQNHGGYYASNMRNLELKIRVEDEDVNRTESEMYVNLIKKSDEMLEELVTYFEAQDDPVVIVMFGDHQANLGEDTYQHLIGSEEDCTQEELMEKYKIPFVIWANYDIKEEEIEKTSLNYLYSILADRLELPMTGYQKYLLKLSEQIPVINPLGYWSADGTFYELNDQTSPYWELIHEYNILEYNDIFGKKNRYLPFFSADSDSEEAS